MTKQEELLKNWVNKFIIIMLSVMGVMVIVYLAFISFYPIPPGNTRIVDTTQGFMMGTVLQSVISVFTQFLIPSKKDKNDEGIGQNTTL